jgi:hypothetical protein
MADLGISRGRSVITRHPGGAGIDADITAFPVRSERLGQ